MDDVTLLAEDGTAVGTLPKSEVHTSETPLHLAFSCYVLDSQGRLLLTRRALAKKTWPGVWTNSFCGHPRPGEEMADAVRRHGVDELGIRLADLRLSLPGYRYRAVDASGIVENEVCPVHVAIIDGQPTANSDEVSEWTWVDVDGLIEAVTHAPYAFSPWLVEQLPLLRRLGEV
ncbi:MULTISPECIES: isopentenyl-diphosphate Delta-isomerase [unclassified Microbacterium]|uniref:isopentenyl-diphosphate Delta-isomerase n=1 Tax=unclassified Microbacterium TaxID=2609290 RepID=UPI000CFAFFAE|nr:MULTISPECIES: isopentenyl-diphosphate Delta-isomerase [unclassified Microbacterium]PQZ56046.1 isopentenyl-diphosphate delta-isomerase [Microbacterium sp. MYb43]PQZ78501.1 isopentenyl-diphosphate delta-isomerase [Microbacterium sp. MYb40]PRB22610.1 isopentenyl-diphosphate delta-isomerase [Microbacterium sp. MYb54]PRB26820.1 isopentenyl-diphosphate delta-isomerase [Microbacterium sp. MYb50]PRB68876.1 isopentenyl-diphosphate delta-isomerase [Microbacterium sp. MYb24]